MFHSNGSLLWIEGQIDSFAIQQIQNGIMNCLSETGVVMDLTESALVTTEMMSRFARAS